MSFFQKSKIELEKTLHHHFFSVRLPISAASPLCSHFYLDAWSRADHYAADCGGAVSADWWSDGWSDGWGSRFCKFLDVYIRGMIWIIRFGEMEQNRLRQKDGPTDGPTDGEAVFANSWMCIFGGWFGFLDNLDNLDFWIFWQNRFRQK